MSISTIGSASLQADDNGMVTLQCERCKARFKMSCQYLNDELEGDICCPICGISDKLNTFYPEEVIEAMKEMVFARAGDLFQKALTDINSKYIKVKSNPIPPVDSKRVFKDNDLDMVIVHAGCCDKGFGITRLDANAGYYCPYCGRIIK